MVETVSFPRVPLWFAASQAGRKPAGMRSFGSASEDLDVSFVRAERPVLVMEILARCCKDGDGAALDQAFWLSMPVSLRLELLLVLASRTDGSAFAWRVNCGSEPCVDEDNEFALTLEQILSVTEDTREVGIWPVSICGMDVTLRRPTAGDQVEWLRAGSALEAEVLLRSLVVSPTLDVLLMSTPMNDVAAAVDEAMTAFDPLMSFHVQVICPRCGRLNEVSPDLAEAALERLLRAQQRALADVHVLAREYHWSEMQILGLPVWRRESYLQMIRGKD